MLSETAIEKLKASLRGELIQRSDEHYEEARKLYNGMIDKRPRTVAGSMRWGDSAPSAGSASRSTPSVAP